MDRLAWAAGAADGRGATDAKSTTDGRMTTDVGGADFSVPVMVSGAGHDAVVMSERCPVGMFFVRCAGGVSHSPAESVLDEDVDACAEAMTAFFLGMATTVEEGGR